MKNKAGVEERPRRRGEEIVRAASGRSLSRGIIDQVTITAEDLDTVRAVEAESPTAALALLGIFIEKAL